MTRCKPLPLVLACLALLGPASACDAAPESDDDDDAGMESSADDDGDPMEDNGDSCTEVWECYGACADEACAQDCYDAGSSDAQEKSDALEECVLDSGCEDAECVQAQCLSELQSCADAGGSGGGGAITCFASARYEVCMDGFCEERTVEGGAQGDSEDEASAAAVADCNDTLNARLILLDDAQTSIIAPCEVTECVQD